MLLTASPTHKRLRRLSGNQPALRSVPDRRSVLIVNAGIFARSHLSALSSRCSRSSAATTVCRIHRLQCQTSMPTLQTRGNTALPLVTAFCRLPADADFEREYRDRVAETNRNFSLPRYQRNSLTCCTYRSKNDAAPAA